MRAERRFKMNWWNISVFIIIPVLSVVIVFFVKKKLLWTAPLISTGSSVIVSIIAMPSIVSYGEHRAMFFMLAVPIHLVISVILTVIAYFAAHILKQKTAERRRAESQQ